MIHNILSLVQHAVPWNWISNFTGYAALRLPLQRSRHDGELTLDVPGYQQLDDFSCGAVAAAMVVKCLRPQMSFERTYAAVDPCPENGTSTTRVLQGLRSLGIRVSRKTKLSFNDIGAALEAGRPIMVCVTTDDEETDHWVVIYGYGRRPNLVFVAGQGAPFLWGHRVDWPTFRRRWAPQGEGIVCWKVSRCRKAHATSRSLEKRK